MVAFIHQHNKAKSLGHCHFHMLDKVGVFTFLEGVIAGFGQLFPVDETGIAAGKTLGHHIVEQLGVRITDIAVHFALALLLETAGAGGEPDKHHLRVCPAVHFHKAGQYKGFAASGRTFEHDIPPGLLHSFIQTQDGVALEFFQLIFHVYVSGLSGSYCLFGALTE